MSNYLDTRIISISEEIRHNIHGYVIHLEMTDADGDITREYRRFPSREGAITAALRLSAPGTTIQNLIDGGIIKYPIPYN